MTPLVAAAPILTLLLAAWVVGRAADRHAADFGLSRVAVADVTLPIVVSALLAARLVAVLPVWRTIAANPLDIVRFTGAGQLSAAGGIVGAGAGLLIFSRHRGLPLPRLADLYGLALPLGLAAYQGGCLARNDCYGRVAPAPFGIVFPGFEQPHYPVGLYMAALALFVYGGVQWLARRQPEPGAVATIAVTAVALSYALLAPLRLETGAGLHSPDLVLAVAVALTALLTWQVLRLARIARARSDSGPAQESRDAPRR